MSAETEDLSGEDDFEKLLNSFINSSLDEEQEKSSADKTTKQSKEEQKLQLTKQGEAENKAASDAFAEEISNTFSEVRQAIEDEKNVPQLAMEESELAQAFINYQSSIDKLAKKNLKKSFDCTFVIDDLYPNYKPSVGRILSEDLVNGWRLLCEMFPEDIAKFPVTSTDEEFLNFAEKLTNSDSQLAVISYVEILIDMECCELSYQAKLAQYQEKHIKKIMYEEYLARKERQQRFIDALKAKNFPIDEQRLIVNYFRVAQKDFDGAYKALITNPAIFAPIDFGKIKPRFFGLVKVTPKDGIRLNIKIGNFLKNLKV